MAAIIVGTTGATWGLIAESGIILQSAGAKDTREKAQVRDESGNFVLISFYNPTKTHTLSGVIIGTSGIADAAPGISLTIANAFTGFGGVTAGGIYTDDVDISATNNEFQKITVNATQYPLIA